MLAHGAKASIRCFHPPSGEATPRVSTLPLWCHCVLLEFLSLWDIWMRADGQRTLHFGAIRPEKSSWRRRLCAHKPWLVGAWFHMLNPVFEPTHLGL